MKKWTQRDATTGGSVSPGAVNDELRAQQSSITTLDRDQLPDAYVTTNRLKDYALMRVYKDAEFPTGGQQDTVVDSYNVPANAWNAATFQIYPGGWQNCSDGVAETLTGWKGGHLHIEWAGNAYIMGGMCFGANQPFPKTPRYLNLRITANGVTIAEKRGPAYHEAFRVIGSSLVPQGDVELRFQWKIDGPSSDDAIFNSIAPTPSSERVPQAHLYSMRYLAIGRWV